jgi:hypothetical protein
MMASEYKNFIKKLAQELRGKGSEEIRQKLEQLGHDLRREITYGGSAK